MSMIATKRRARKTHRCLNPYPCGNRKIQPGETYWALALPPGSDPFNAKGWSHDAECVDCYEDRHGLPLDVGS
jgi:hypothetical protein